MSYTGTTVRAALPVIIALMLGAAPQEARAGACRKADLGSGCVKKRDIARDSLSRKDMKSQSEAYFTLEASVEDISATLKRYAEVGMKPPSDGFLMITASVDLSAGGPSQEARGQVECTLKFGRRLSTSKEISPFFGASVSSRFFGGGPGSAEFKGGSSVASSTVLPVKGGKGRKVFLACRRFSGEFVNVALPAITVVFHPVKY